MDWLANLARGARRHWAAGLAAGLAELDAALYPPLCWLCRERPCVDGLGCAAHALEPCRFDPREARCAGCGERLPEGLARGPCAACRRRPRGYRRLVAAGPYRRGRALAEWILAFKHGGRGELARPLAAFLAPSFEAAVGAAPGALLTSVPLHPLRRFERGYDQARLLGRELGGRLELPFRVTLRRVRWTRPQGAGGTSTREANVSGAFALLARGRAALAGREVWLVDDVVTSGATARACAAVLRRAGARSVSVLALARVERATDAQEGRPATLGDSRPAPGAPRP